MTIRRGCGLLARGMTQACAQKDADKPHDQLRL
jgi:hypothetical protein